MSLLPRLRLAFARRPWLYWLVVACCAALVWGQLAAVRTRAETDRASWGASRLVWVAVDDANPGEPIAVEQRRAPLAMVPSTILSDLPDLPIAARSVVAGQMLTPPDVATEHTPPRDWVTFSVPLDGTPTLHDGDAIAVFAVGRRLCDGMVGLGTDVTVEFAVPPECADAVSSAVAAREVVLGRSEGIPLGV